MVDYIIVGAGLAGVAFAEKALSNNKSIIVFEDDSQNSSRIAAGLYNPVILKRFSSTYQAQEQLDSMNLFYNGIQSRFNRQFNHVMPILRRFFSIEEQNNWYDVSDKPALSAFITREISNEKFDGLDSPYGFGKVMQTGWVNTEAFLQAYVDNLEERKLLVCETFDYSKLELNVDFVSYKGINARHIIFAEGYGIHSNPYFKYLPLDGTKGEMLIIEAHGLDLNVIINSGVFILPLGEGLFKVGATYNWADKTPTPTEEGKVELIEKLNEVITCNYKIISHLAGVRPTVKDRKPLVGTHPLHTNLHVLNGLGTRGVMLAPSMADELFQHVESNKPLPIEIDIKRYRASLLPADRNGRKD